jgi:transcriptional regulator with XRE-family HTH domain
LKYLTSTESMSWLQKQLDKSGVKSISQLARITGINKGTLSKYFRQIQRPTIDVVAILCTALSATPSEVLFGLGAIAGQDDLNETSTPESDLS